ncbi:hypothetical protein PSI23_09045 [Xenorhabdus sp. XENO-10]|uniref:Uncharacterized protein n=1 Tax=Xenorhabdus yunnanensis TaxID=3025878 RepID=A0ABT5LHW2_9GAMM|nr:hypothetical protein [Xenorhabdus yunnanensis]MDC9589454.1 hypothetical protein [Xenorhabdus yunnanensis]
MSESGSPLDMMPYPRKGIQNEEKIAAFQVTAQTAAHFSYR